MSSFVINKKDYSRLAGALAAIGLCKDYYGENNFYKWNSKKGRIYNSDDIEGEIMSLYDLNVKSVNLQYGINSSGDDAEYRADFEKYYNKVIALYRRAYAFHDRASKEEFNKLCYYINDFFSSVGYQIEDVECCKKAAEIMNWYSRALLRVMKKINETQESMTWGSFDYFEEE